MDENVKKEAKRLHEKFGNLSIEVVKEVRKYDQTDSYFWNKVIIAIREM